ncbi:gag/pol/env polyprotein, putative [Perkinsus marinus ATCC 50983]|nr:gag/pol/env polyprotein, putative [Perkinsus marinus ATCC 50983]XP_002780093.1 gag/pol/env polyprotein, putative [Perkinsus marinus ATCC 50983]XP_002786519.1 gag/pol/env polyprotein, putative [Perkinsus marinus ATCC 50983]XP_002787523.1 gag/pol/env polyprotein, putative [Perkinsus marinus ATCC 50983]EER00072.1 gag/pol/env polyprotein, putative [Perkinsus marinus ATCC 50983]EER11888.1 gag/pol/env polyprotein, putative [Perkinsus marinus ATCC 50983]EER18315.1 gag/pol/env polyprotein, putativ|eukprot:XP_002767354.1 gag/pol/env polyprotein, putative [Perkinsus marinus ATCC 50983]
MDAVGVLTTTGQVDLPVMYLAKDGWVKVVHTCYVVDKMVFGSLVLGADFASLYCQGMTWDEGGRIAVTAAAARGIDEDVQAYNLPDIPGVRVLEYPNGTVEIISIDFVLSKRSDEPQFTCRWIWRGGDPPGTFYKANRGDYNPKLTAQEELNLRAETDKLITNGWVKPYAGRVRNILPWVLVAQPHKPSTPLRMCLDFRALNKHLVSEPVRDIVNCVDTLHQWRSVRRGYTLDVIKCYYCIRMCESLWPYLCVMINGEIFTMVVMGFGVCIAPKVATSAIRWLLMKVPYPISSYLDDVVIEESDPNVVIAVNQNGQLLEDPPCVTAVRDALGNGRMYCKPTIIIGANNSRVLGLSLHNDGGEISWARREDLSLEINLDGDEVVTKRELAGWCGKLTALVPVASWLRPHVSMLLRVISALAWDKPVDAVYLDLAHYIQQKFNSEGDPARGIWYCPRPSDAKAWHIHADASSVAMGATLSYERDDGKIVLVRDAAWLLDRRGVLRHINVTELCAATRALAWAAPFIAGAVYLHVDNECVRSWIERYQSGQTVKRGGLSTTIVGRRLQAIVDITEPFKSFTVCRVASDQNPSDILSRLDSKYTSLIDSICYDNNSMDIEADLSLCAGAAINEPLLNDEMFLNLGEVVEGQYDDDELFKARRALKHGRLLPEDVELDLQQVYRELEIDEYDILRRRYIAPYQGKEVCVPVIPEGMRVELIHSVHGLLCHVGQRRTFEAITSIAWFPGIIDQTAAWLQKCDICNRRTQPLIIKHDISLFSSSVLSEAEPFSVVSADIVYLPKAYLSQQCAVCRFACLIELEGEDADHIRDAFEASWRILGKRPKILLTDNQTGFLSCDLPGVSRVFTAPRSSQSNGMVESLHRTVRMWTRSVMADDNELDIASAVAKVMRAYNNTVHSVTQRIPAEMMKLESTDVEWQRLIAKCVADAERKLESCTYHELFPGAIVRMRQVNKYDKIITKTMDMPFSEKRWRVLGFISSSRGLVTTSPNDDYGLFRKAKIICDKEVKVVHVSRLTHCKPGEVDVQDLRRAMRRMTRDSPQ